VYRNTTLPASSTFHARIRATSPRMLSSITYSRPLKVAVLRGLGYLAGWG
jgi:hypothetical protein